jgi:hypothetical protein
MDTMELLTHLYIHTEKKLPESLSIFSGAYQEFYNLDKKPGIKELNDIQRGFLHLQKQLKTLGFKLDPESDEASFLISPSLSRAQAAKLAVQELGLPDLFIKRDYYGKKLFKEHQEKAPGDFALDLNIKEHPLIKFIHLFTYKRLEGIGVNQIKLFRPDVVITKDEVAAFFYDLAIELSSLHLQKAPKVGQAAFSRVKDLKKGDKGYKRAKFSIEFGFLDLDSEAKFNGNVGISPLDFIKSCRAFLRVVLKKEEKKKKDKSPEKGVGSNK